jgi:hypothetical protein
MTVAEVQIRPLHTEDAERCDQIIASLPYHFGQEDGRGECADAVRSQPGLVVAVAAAGGGGPRREPAAGDQAGHPGEHR